MKQSSRMYLVSLRLKQFCITVGSDVFKLKIKLLLEQIKLIEEHLQTIEQTMIDLSNRQDHFLTTTTGISDVTASVILGEIGSISRFERPEQLVAFEGLDASVSSILVISTVIEPGFRNVVLLI